MLKRKSSKIRCTATSSTSDPAIGRFSWTRRLSQLYRRAKTKNDAGSYCSSFPSSRQPSSLFSEEQFSHTSSPPPSSVSMKLAQRSSESVLVQPQDGPLVIPPYSPTYCKPNEFPYSNFYMKLPDGRWMLRYRDGNREILGTEILEDWMIWGEEKNERVRKKWCVHSMIPPLLSLSLFFMNTPLTAPSPSMTDVNLTFYLHCKSILRICPSQRII